MDLIHGRTIVVVVLTVRTLFALEFFSKICPRKGVVYVFPQ